MSNIKPAENLSSAKKRPTKAVLDRNKMNMEKLLILEFLTKQTVFELGLPDVK